MSGFKLNWDVAEKELFFDFKLKNTLSHKTYPLKPESYGLIFTLSLSLKDFFALSRRFEGSDACGGVLALRGGDRNYPRSDREPKRHIRYKSYWSYP